MALLPLWNSRRWMVPVVLEMMVLLLLGCKTPRTGGAEARPASAAAGRQAPLTAGSGYVHLTFQPNVHVMEEEEGTNAIIGITSNDAGLLFDGSYAPARALKAGDVLMIKGLLARTVLAAETTPEGVMVLTQQATLTDLIQDGEIHLQAPARFGVSRASLQPGSETLWQSFGDLLSPAKAYAQSPESVAASQAEAKGTMDAYGNMVKGTLKSIVDDWDTTLQATPADGQTNLKITLKKDVGGFVALITGDGYISNFDFNTDINIKQSQLQQMTTSFNNLNGRMNFQWSVAKEGGGVVASESRIKMPGAIEIPLARYLSGLPLYLEVSAALIVHPGVTGGAEYSKGEFRIAYDGYQGFRVNKGNIDANGNVTGDIELLEHQYVSPTAPMAMLVAFAAPRVELTLGLIKLYNKSDAKTAAEKVDQIADYVAKKFLNPQQYNAYQNGPLGGFSLGKAFKNILSTDGVAYFEMIGTSASSFTGMSTITPCSRYDLSLVGKVGASAEAWGASIGTVSKDIYKREISKVDPPGMKLCEDIGKK